MPAARDKWLPVGVTAVNDDEGDVTIVEKSEQGRQRFRLLIEDY